MASLVSAVIPTYNYAHFVGRAVDSVLAQTYTPIECIVVDDGSTDNTQEVLARYGGKITTILQQNKGLSAARNTGIGAATGEFIAFLDADDWWEPNKIAEQMDYVSKHGEIDIVGCGLRRVGSSGRVSREDIFSNPAGNRLRDFQDVARRRLWVGGSGSGALVRKSVFNSVGLFDEELNAAEDWDMWLRIVAKYNLYNLPVILSNIYFHHSGVFRNVERMEKNQRRVFEKAIEQWPEAMTKSVRREVDALIIADAGGEFLGIRDEKRALNRYMDAIRCWPFRLVWWRIVTRLLINQVTGRPGILEP